MQCSVPLIGATKHLSTMVGLQRLYCEVCLQNIRTFVLGIFNLLGFRIFVLAIVANYVYHVGF